MSNNHPEDAGMQRVELDPEITSAAINDAINEYESVLIERGIIDENAWEADSELLELKYEIVERMANKWRVSWKSPNQ